MLTAGTGWLDLGQPARCRFRHTLCCSSRPGHRHMTKWHNAEGLVLTRRVWRRRSRRCWAHCRHWMTGPGAACLPGPRRSMARCAQVVYNTGGTMTFSTAQPASTQYSKVHTDAL